MLHHVLTATTVDSVLAFAVKKLCDRVSMTRWPWRQSNYCD